MATIVLSHSEARDLRNAALPSTALLRYPLTTATLPSIQDELKRVPSVNGIRNIGLHVQTREGRLVLSAQSKATVDKTSLRIDSSPTKRFFRWLFAERMGDGSFVDFFLSQPLHGASSTLDLIPLLQILTKKKISIRFVNRFLASDLPPHNQRIVDLYFDPGRIRRGRTGKRGEMGPSPAIGERQHSATHGYERIRVVGKGAFGAAILYRRRDDDSLVIIKEINMHDLAANERQLALNEVHLLSRLDHPAIISYFDSFEEDGVLMIEMEFADGGTLAQYLSRCDSFLPELEVQELMRQMLSAVVYLHAKSVLHRDLKTANIFLTRDGAVKIGDFGISRIMGSDTMQKGAETVVGTPYYISPEMCQGLAYNEKSDVWALGCILYEMSCLQKAFEGDNLPALVNKIMKGEYDPVRGPYTSSLKLLIRDMLNLDPNQRPTAAKALEMLDSIHGGSRRPPPPSFSSSSSIRSVVYSLDVSTVSLTPIASVPARIKVAQVAIGPSHTVIVAAAEHTIYAWGSNGSGQLGLGDKKERLFLADRGTLLVAGDRRMTGNGKEPQDQLEPELVTSLMRMDIVDIACGDEHAVAVSSTGIVLVWGSGGGGRLGNGPLLSSLYVATPLPLPPNTAVNSIKCGPDATVLITEEGNMVAMGSNRFNKLNLAQRQGFFSKDPKGSFDDILVPTPVKPFPARVVDVSMGRNHTGVVLESGLVYLFGLNVHGELGTGTFHPMPTGWHIPVKSLLSQVCVMVACGDGFSLAATADNQLFFWGSKGALAPSSLPLALDDEATECRVLKWREGKEGGEGNCRGTTNTNHERSFRWPLKRRSETESIEVVEQIVSHPSLVLRLDTGEGSVPLRLSALSCSGRRVVVVVDTSMPPKTTQMFSSYGGMQTMPSTMQRNGKEKKAKRMEKGKRKQTALPRRVAPLQRQHSAPSLGEDTQPWIRRELQNADHIPIPAYLATSAVEGKEDGKEGRLAKQIETLRRQLHEQSSVSAGQAQQMSLLQTGLGELREQQLALRTMEPPPEYSQSTKKVVYNGFFPDQPPTASSRACSIL